MSGQIVTFFEGALSSPWGLLALAAIAAIDGFFPARRSAAFAWAAKTLAERGGTVIPSPLEAFLGLALTVAGVIELLRHARRRMA
jgi:hypothetical protein